MSRAPSSHAGNLQRHLFDSNLPENVETLEVIRHRVEAHNGANGGGDRFVFGEFSEEEERCGAYLSPTEGLHSAYTFVLLLARRLTPQFIKDHYATLDRFPAHWPTISFSNHDVPRTVSRFGGEEASADLARLLFALLLSLKGTTLIYQGEELGLPQAAGPALGFTAGAPWLPAAPEHASLTVAAQEADPESTLAFAREMIAFRKGSAALTVGELTFLDVPDPVLAFVRRDGDEAIACLFNLSPEPRFVEAPELAGAILLEARAGDADLRGGSIGLSAWAACFLRL
jgi:alpha-glucosidase